MRFRNPLLNWIAERPGGAMFALVGILLLLAMLAPILFYLTPIRKVPLVYNLRNLQNRWMTTAVTALAFTLVTALLTGMLAFVRGMDRLIEASGNPGNVMVLSDGATDEAFSNLPPFVAQDLPSDVQKQIVSVPTDPRDPGKKTPLISQEVYVVVMYMIPNAPPGSRQRRFVQMRGMNDIAVAALVHEVKLARGDWPSPAGVKDLGNGETAIEIIVGAGLARTFAADLGKSELELGDTVTIRDRKWVIVGVMEEASNSFGSEIWTRDAQMQKYFGRENSYSSYVVRTENAQMANLAVKEIKSFKRDRTLQAYTEREYYAKMTDTSKQLSVAIYVVAFIMAIGGMLGVMNTMYAAISQRSKDIGVLRLMGYQRWQILLSFQFESLLIALMGGALGCLLAYLAVDGQTVTSLISGGGGGGGGKTVVLRITFDLTVLIVGVIFSILMGCLGGAFPSVSAMRVRPLESLK